jgi:hypothetical protein
MGCKQVESKKPQGNFDTKFMDDTPSNRVKSSLFSQGVLSQTNLISEYVKINLVAKPLYDPFELVILDLGNKKISIDSTINDPKLKNFNVLSSFCNGRDKLFISGGDSETSNSFCIIDLIDKKVDFKVMKNSRRGHSMIYIPNEFIFIVGGTSTKSVEIYNINSKEFNPTEHSTLNEIRLEPALCLIDNSYLYAFTGFKKEMKKTFERINLRTNATHWELINVNLEKNLTFGQNFFAVSYYKQNEVIFLGGCDTESNSSHNKKTHIFNFKTNLLSSAPECDISEQYTEKFFIPVYEAKNLAEENNSHQNLQNLTSIVFPNFNRNDIKVSIFFNLKLTEVKFEIEK